jgi:hypothetical protein
MVLPSASAGNESMAPVAVGMGDFALDPLTLIDVRKADFDILRPKRHETPAHYIQAALTSLGIVVGAPIVQPVRIRARAITSARLASAAVTKLGLEDR